MPIYEYAVTEGRKGCEKCTAPFGVLQRISDAPLAACPSCKAPLRRLISAPSIGASGSGLDDRARSAGFHKLKRLGAGEYEKQY